MIYKNAMMVTCIAINRMECHRNIQFKSNKFSIVSCIHAYYLSACRPFYTCK